MLREIKIVYFSGHEAHKKGGLSILKIFNLAADFAYSNHFDLKVKDVQK